MQACARIGATIRWCSAASRRRALQERIIDAGAVAVITADGQMRGGTRDPAQARGRRGARAWAAARRSRTSSSTSAPAAQVPMERRARQLVARRRCKGQPDTCEPTWVNAEHPLFILYTSGSTGKPKGVQHSTGGYLLQAIADDEVGVRLQADRRLLVHGRRGLGHRPHLHLLRPARRAARPRSCSRACRPIPTPAASGR